MLPVFVYPLAFIGLASLPILAAIYILRNRHRRHVVSSLMLWMDPREAREGGTRIRRLQTPLLFFLELLLLLLLVLAAAGPYVHSSEGARPLVVVLDDSFSMLASGADSARNQALKAIEEELDARGRPSVRFVLAGERPTLLGEPARTPREAADVLRGWRCQSPAANLEEALALAAEAARLMGEKQVRRLPVLNRDKRLVGIVSLGNLAVETGDEQMAGHALEGISEPSAVGR